MLSDFGPSSLALWTSLYQQSQYLLTGLISSLCSCWKSHLLTRQRNSFSLLLGKPSCKLMKVPFFPSVFPPQGLQFASLKFPALILMKQESLLIPPLSKWMTWLKPLKLPCLTAPFFRPLPLLSLSRPCREPRGVSFSISLNLNFVEVKGYMAWIKVSNLPLVKTNLAWDVLLILPLCHLLYFVSWAPPSATLIRMTSLMKPSTPSPQKRGSGSPKQEQKGQERGR